MLCTKHIQGLQKDVQPTNEFPQPLQEKHIPTPMNALSGTIMWAHIDDNASPLLPALLTRMICLFTA